MCGIAGIQSQEPDVAIELYEALHGLQHRGQDAAGIVTFDGRFFHEKKGNGFVREVFTEQDVKELKGSTGLGHVRYPTAGSLGAKNAQPFFVNVPFGMYLVHNGNLIYTDELRKKVTAKYHRHLRTDSDSELLLNVFANALFKVIKEKPNGAITNMIQDAVTMTMDRIQGAYSVIMLIDGVGMLAFRDPHGIRPLVLGKRGKGEYMFASESAAFGSLGFELVRDVRPGEMILVSPKGALVKRQCKEGTLNPCIFEYIYFARPDSLMDDILVYKTQLRLGRMLARQIVAAHLPIDTVMPIPDSSRPAALEIAQTLGVPYREGLVKNRYIGRTFIMPDQKVRNKSVSRKLNTMPLEFEGKNVLLVDDSIVRGTTSRHIVEMCRAAGAKKVYFASAAPAVRYSNVYGVDLPTQDELIAHGRTTEEVAKEIKADKLFYQTVEDMYAAARAGNKSIERFEDSCFTGDYVTGDVTKAYLRKVEQTKQKKQNVHNV